MSPLDHIVLRVDLSNRWNIAGVVSLNDFAASYAQIELAWKVAFDFLTLLRSNKTQGVFGLAGDTLYDHLKKVTETT